MSKRRRSKGRSTNSVPEQRFPESELKPWYRRAWFVFSLASIGLSAAGSALIWVLMSGPTAIANAEKLPSDIERVANRFLAWYYEDAAWSGLWSGNAEGYVNSVDMRLSNVDLLLHLIPERGRIGGEIATKSICRKFPILDYFLIEGTVSGKTATITAFDFIGGKRQTFFTFTAKRDGPVLTLSPNDGTSEWLPKEARIASVDMAEGDITSAKAKDPYRSLTNYCLAERKAFMKLLNPDTDRPVPSGRRPIEELRFGAGQATER